MGKAHITAIIQSLQETVESLMTNGLSARSKISSPISDAQYVESLEGDYGDDIDAIIETIPDDPPTPPEPPAEIEVLFGLRWEIPSGPWLPKTFTQNDFWWAGILSEEDKARIEAFGLETYLYPYPDSQWYGTIGTIKWSDDYQFTPIALYSDIEGTQQVEADMTNFSCGSETTAAVGGQEASVLVIQSGDAFGTYCMSWKCKIAKK